MAQDPEHDDEHFDDEGAVDISHDLDMVSLFRSATIDAEVEADMIQGILEANGIPAVVWRATGIPPLGVEVQVPRNRIEEARRVIAEQVAAGPEAAAEGEAASEEGK
jgi:Putative prokaryotic signal transducing protein